MTTTTYTKVPVYQSNAPTNTRSAAQVQRIKQVSANRDGVGLTITPGYNLQGVNAIPPTKGAPVKLLTPPELMALGQTARQTYLQSLSVADRAKYRIYFAELRNSQSFKQPTSAGQQFVAQQAAQQGLVKIQMPKMKGR